MEPRTERFEGARLELARNFKGWTQSELAQRVVASPGTISLYERARIKSNPPDHLVAALAEVTGFAPGFFFIPVADPFGEHECNFRHRRSTPETVKKRARAHGTLLGMVVDQLATHLRVRFPKYNVPTIAAATPTEIEAAAEECRKFWKLGTDTPIVHIGRVLEHAGVVLFQHFSASEKVDAFSRRGQINVIFLNVRRFTASRWIFDIAHETGHLVLHSNRDTGTEQTETEADRFASAFLLPRKAFGSEFSTRALTWDHIFALKKRWRTSAAAIIRRAYDLGLIGAVTYRSLFKARSARGWIYNEPFEPEFQPPELLRSAFEVCRAEDLRSIAASVHMSINTFEEVTGWTIPLKANKRTVVLFEEFIGKKVPAR
jgi:Zn-dependent peptidase ImmA (M78 family)/transcriptional regulator with XRE-family HTH domain